MDVYYYPGSTPSNSFVPESSAAEDSVTQTVIIVRKPGDPRPICIEELKWWSSQLHHWSGRDVHPQSSRMMIDTDASPSLVGCNSVCTGRL